MRVLVVNAGSTSLKLHLVEGEESRPVDSFAECDAVGHRVVHGAARFVEPTVVDEEVVAALRELTPLAPLHNAPALRAIEEAQTVLPDRLDAARSTAERQPGLAFLLPATPRTQSSSNCGRGRPTCGRS